MSIKIKRTGPVTWHYEFDGWHALVFLLAIVAIGAGSAAMIVSSVSP